MRLAQSAPWTIGSILIILIVLLASYLRGQMFENNPQYEIKNIEVKTGIALDRTRVLDLAGIYEGANIHSFSSEKLCKALKEVSLNIAEVSVVKEMPDTVRIDVRDRIPVATIQDKDHFVDDKGLVFMRLPYDAEKFREIPTFTFSNAEPFNAGYVIRGDSGYPRTFEQRVARGLMVLRLMNQAQASGSVIHPRWFDLSNDIYLSVGLKYNKDVRFVWEEIKDEASIMQAITLLDAAINSHNRNPRNSRNRHYKFDVLLSNKRVIAQ